MEIKNIKNNTIIITNYNNKINILKELNNNQELLNINFLSLKELKERIYFSYDEKAIYYLMNKYNIKYEIAIIYLENMYFIEDKKYKNGKLRYLSNLKQELLKENLLYLDNLFLNYLKDKCILFYDTNYFSKDEQKLIELLKKHCSVSFYTKKEHHYKHDIIEFENIYDEIEFVATEIVKLISQGINPNNIKLTNLDEDYLNITRDIFKLYNLDISNPSKIISSKICSMFLNMPGSIEERIKTLKDKYKNNEVLEKLVKIVNKYIIFDNLDIVNEMIKYELKKINLPTKIYKNTIEIVDYLNYPINDNDYVFLVNFNQNSMPKLFKDEDYITDNMKDEVPLDTTSEKNKHMRENTIKKIINIKNLIITYKKTTPFKTYFASDLIGDLNFEVKPGSISLDDSYSDKYNKIKLSKKLDNYIKTGVIENDTNYLYSNYNDIEFSSFDNKYKGIDNESFHKSLNNHFDLAYSSMNNYYKCPFRYYLANILKLDIYEEKFETYLGSLFHYVLENNLKNNKDVDTLVNEFIINTPKELTKKEQFFINKTKSDINYVIEIIKEQLENTDLKDMLFEDRIAIEKKRGNVTVTFKGFIDKIMYREEEGKTIVAIIDYKTGPTDIKLEYAPYGLYLQLPVYLYLAKNSKSINNVSFAGFYLERVLNSEVNVSSKKSYEALKRDNYLLYGYSNSDEETLHKFDHTYKDSRFIKSMKVKNDGTFQSYTKVLTNDQIEKLIKVVDTKVDEAIKNISETKFDIKPKKNDKELIGCNYCKFRDICFKEAIDEEQIKPDKDLTFLGGDING